MMTVSELYRQLKEKGYDNESADWYARCQPDLNLKIHLEFDRRKVFELWYGVPTNGARLVSANLAYEAYEIDSCIDYILQHP